MGEEGSPVLIISTFGPTREYSDPDMMQSTLRFFLGSLLGQTSPRWHSFIACHDEPVFPGIPKDDRIHWESVSGDPSHQTTLVYLPLPERFGNGIELIRTAKPFDNPLTDMSRKTFTAIVSAMRFAFANKLKRFWLLRMDSDDMISRDLVEDLQRWEVKNGIRAVFCRKAYMFDPRLVLIAEHRYCGGSLTCNALLYEMNEKGEVTPYPYYLAQDHTLFARQVKSDGIPYREKDWALCITTNSGNSISGRPPIYEEKNTSVVAWSNELLEKFGKEVGRYVWNGGVWDWDDQE